MKNISEVIFKNDFIENFPGDGSGSLVPRQTPGMLYSKALPTPVSKVSLLAWSDDLARDLELSKPTMQEDMNILGGNLVTPSMVPYAACYAGHQFGSWAGQLGDGRAITLGELPVNNGNKWELQLKGAGPTAYSRRGDGRAVLRSSLREYLISEAMFYLRVPTTRALSLVSTGEQVLRDMFYDGNASYEPGAIVMRVAPTFLRFGNFEILAARGEEDNLERLVHWTITTYYPHIKDANPVLTWFREVVQRTAQLMVEWQRVGFVHGVMNTDNMSVLGLTIDYGPFSFVDNYDPLFTPNTTDLPGRRYAFGRQAAVAKWNLGCLAGAILPLVGGEEELVAAIETYDEVYRTAFYNMMTAKLGLDKVGEEEHQLIADLEKMLTVISPDLTIFYQLLIDLPENGTGKDELLNHFKPCFYQDLSEGEQNTFLQWMQRYGKRRTGNATSQSIEQMRQANPRFILRNYLLHQSIEELERGDDSLFVKLQAAIKEPYSKRHEEFFQKRPDWASQKAGCSMLSCSS